LRLLFVSPYPPVRDGIGDYTSALVEAMVARGHEVRVVAARSRDGVLAEEAIAEVPGPRHGVEALVAEVRRFDPDVVHVQFAVAGFGVRTLNLVRLLAALRGERAKVVVTFHEVTRDTETLRAPGRRLYRRVAALTDTAVAHNRRAADALAALAPGTHVEVLPHPKAELPEASVAPAALRERLGLADRRVLLAFGFVHVDKGLEVLVEAARRLRAEPRFADVAVLVAGTVRPRHGPLKPFEWRDQLHLRAVKRAIASGGLARDVVFSGYVPSAEIAPTFALADVAVLPYRRIEDSGVANLAMAAGAPMVVTDAGVLPEYVPDPTRRVPPGDAAALAAALARFLDRGPGPVEVSDDAPLPPGAEFADVVTATLALYATALGARA
jgi:glycosyltransferase involved in cell wall biosynthesis